MLKSQKPNHKSMAMKMKRKDIDRVSDEFCDFSLSSPARKIRRLDLDLPPILEEEETQSAPVNEERAIVLFNPHHQPPTPNLYLDPHLISGFTNRFLRTRDVHDDLYDDEDDKHQALIPWEPTQLQFLEDPPEPEIVELDGEDAIMDEAFMEVEEPIGTTTTNVSWPQSQSQSQSQWQQQQQLHCMIPQLPQTNSTPIPWFR